MADIGVPRLDFGEWRVAFPERGEYTFLPTEDLHSPRPWNPDDQESGLLLGRTESGVSIIVPVRLSIQREGVQTVSFAVLHQGEQLTIAGHDVRFEELRTVTLRENARLVGQVCNQCRTVLMAGATVIPCPLCQAPYCDDCWDFLVGRKCYSRACNYSPVAPAGGE